MIIKCTYTLLLMLMVSALQLRSSEEYKPGEFTKTYEKYLISGLNQPSEEVKEQAKKTAYAYGISPKASGEKSEIDIQNQINILQGQINVANNNYQSASGFNKIGTWFSLKKAE
jgi:hypothetical protein